MSNQINVTSISNRRTPKTKMVLNITQIAVRASVVLVLLSVSLLAVTTAKWLFAGIPN